jgi:hypothetical protein
MPHGIAPPRIVITTIITNCSFINDIRWAQRLRVGVARLHEKPQLKSDGFHFAFTSTRLTVRVWFACPQRLYEMPRSRIDPRKDVSMGITSPPSRWVSKGSRAVVNAPIFLLFFLASTFMNPSFLLLFEKPALDAARVSRSATGGNHTFIEHFRNFSAETASRANESNPTDTTAASIRSPGNSTKHPATNETVSMSTGNDSVVPKGSNQSFHQDTGSTEVDVAAAPLPSILGVFGYASTSRRPFDAFSDVGEDVSTNKPIAWSGSPSAEEVMTVFREDGKENQLDTMLFQQGFDVLRLWASSTNDTAQDDESRRSVNHVIVSGYFPMPSKHPQRRYQKWISNFLSLQDAMVIFTEASMVSFLVERRQHAVNRTVLVVARPNSKHIQLVTEPRHGGGTNPAVRMKNESLEDNDFTGFWSLPVRHIYQHLDPNTTQFIERNLARLAPTPRTDHSTFWDAQFAMDVEYFRHKGPPLFWVWLSKTWMVQKAIQLSQQAWRHDPLSAELPPLFPAAQLFTYLDIGFFRDTRYSSELILHHPEVFPADRLLLAAHQEPSPPPLPPLQDNVTAGSTDRIDAKLWNDKMKDSSFSYQVGGAMGGSPKSWQRYHNAFLQVVDRFVRAGLFVGEDQPLFQQTCNSFPQFCAYIPASGIDDSNWFHMRTIMYQGIVPPAALWYPPTD